MSLQILFGAALVFAMAVPTVQGKDVMHVGIRDGYLKSLEYKDVWAAAKAIGVNRLEVVVTPELNCSNLYEPDGSTHKIGDKASISRLKKTLKKQRISICAFTTVIPLSGEQTPTQVQQWVSAVDKVAQQLKVPVLMMPLIAKGIEDDEFIKRAREFVVPLETVARQTGLQLTIENLGHYLNREEILDPILNL